MAADQWKRDYRFHRTNQLARRWLVKVYSPSGVGGRELSQFEVLRRRRTAHTTEHASNKAQFIISQPVVKARVVQQQQFAVVSLVQSYILQKGKNFFIYHQNSTSSTMKQQKQQRSLAIVMLFRILTIWLFSKAGNGNSVDADLVNCPFSEKCQCTPNNCNGLTRVRCVNLHEIPEFSENHCSITSMLLEGNFSSVSKERFFNFKDVIRKMTISTTSSQPLVFDDEAFYGVVLNEIERLEINAAGKMSEIPLGVMRLWRLNTLIINGTDIESLNDVFSKYTFTLRTLRISNSQLMNIDSDVFSELRFFTTLELPRNKLKQIPKQALLPVQWSLRLLDLSYNEITSVEEDTFFGFQRLRQLNLSNNPIALINDRAFANNTIPLLTLDLSHCQLESIPTGTLVRLQLLRYLNVSFNRIAHISGATFANMTSLVSVDLSNNPIKTVAVDAFYGASFQSVTLSNTELQQLDLGIFDTLTALREMRIVDSPSLQKLHASFSHSNANLLPRVLGLRNVGTLELDRSLFELLLKLSLTLDIDSNDTVRCDAATMEWLTALIRCYDPVNINLDSIYCEPTKGGDDFGDASSANKTLILDSVLNTDISCELYSTTTTTSVTDEDSTRSTVRNRNNAGSTILPGNSFMHSVAVVVVAVAATLVIS
ncbi:Leucine-rich repeat-containing G-protein coupled receptor 6 [Trichinella pseudospiralis]|uniref:Leucine-rich repeat-containing G-protein coupled receptor 6 n=1 Tax=Trichinella pseudospiralis TaxID=6337 RepID=A0A0V1FBN1_TRIPS|nr:Leucine-rich repeat-containing G-protein coupled receptor 6 [Trichinella pseudospiralis]